MTSAQSPRVPGIRFYAAVWLTLVVIAGLEVLVTQARPSTGLLLATLLALAVIEAGIALLYFLHLRYEHRRLFWSLIPALIVVLVLMDHFFPDALRLMHQRLPAP
jgi:caa(3)-type oxidase subunit IV